MLSNSYQWYENLIITKFLNDSNNQIFKMKEVGGNAYLD